MKLITLKLPEEDYQYLKRYAEENSTTMSNVIRVRIKPVIEEVKAEKKDFFEATKHLVFKSREKRSLVDRLTDDEIVYGRALDKRGNKVWEKL